MSLRVRLALGFLLGVGMLAGCSSDSKPEYGDKKEDWAKTQPPAEWKGPGQEDTAASAPIGGPRAGK